MAGVLKVRGSAMSTCTRRVLTALEELHVPYELVNIDLSKGEHKAPAYVEKYQPFGQIPSLEEADGTVLFESRAILRYIALKYGKGTHSLYPTNDLKTYAQIEKWLNVESDEYNPKVSKIVSEVFFKKFMGGTADQKVVDEQITALKPVLDVLEKHFASSKYEFIAGKHFTIADITFLPYTEYLVLNPEHAKLIESRPHLAAWWKRVRALPAWQKLTKQH